MYWDIVEVQSVGKRTLQIKFADGLMGRVQIPLAFCTGVFSPLLDDAQLQRVFIQHGALTWVCGLDLAPDTMYREIQHSPNHLYEVGCHHYSLTPAQTQTPSA